MLSEAIEYPLEGDEAMQTLLIGGAIYLASGVIGFFAAATSLIPLVGLVVGPLVGLVSLVPSVLLGGYSVAISRAVMAGETEPPAFDDWGALARDGLSVLAIWLLYVVPGAILGVVGFGTFLGIAAVAGADSTVANVLLLAIGGIGSVVGLAYVLVVGYVLPAALVNFARTGSLSAAWDVPTLRTVVTDGSYAKAWVVGLVFLLAAHSAGGSLVWILVGFLVFFYGQVAAMYVFTVGSMEALDSGPEPGPSPTPDRDSTDEDTIDGDPIDEESAAGDPIDEESAAGDESTGAPFGDGAGAEEGTGADEDTPTDGDEGAEEDDGTTGADGGSGDAERAITDVAGVGPTTAEALRDAGFESVADIRTATRRDLAEVTGIGPAMADQIKDDVGDA